MERKMQIFGRWTFYAEVKVVNMKGFKAQEWLAHESNSKDVSVTTAEWMKGVTEKQNKELGKKKRN